ncbi:MAG: hypothetical protein U1F43_06315 [Myxococcota bacterium]
MNINSVSTSLVQQTATTARASATNGTSRADCAPSGPPPSDVSGIGKAMAKLGELAKSDPAAFEKATADIAKKLEELAKSQSGDAATRISDLAKQFANASETGDMSALEPPSRPHHAHGARGPQGPPPPRPDSDGDSDDGVTTKASDATRDPTATRSTGNTGARAYAKVAAADARDQRQALMSQVEDIIGSALAA